ncbi:molybdate ABC transporter substrate-binding protein [Terrilactibacillus laevilacticus]|uniref:molybdate ABC transporter substrate-binding protein n=1 Tax=Terrilactibacillus laevilacticus TaxID=1380157 RepID=UPI0015EFAEB0|nr:molybdate ABC transporter substrate-binding protein [Terrilactibacillus laevilacticus]
MGVRYCGYLFICFILIISSGCSASFAKRQDGDNVHKKVTITLSAAASLQDALRTIQKQYDKKQNHTEVIFNFGGSGTLKQQIREGAPVDLFFSADEGNFRELVDQGLIKKKKNVLGNQLVLITSRKSANKLLDFNALTSSKVHQLAIGTPDSVPAGTYAKQTLTSLELWSRVKSKIVYAKDVRQVLTYVETNNVDAGLVYKTDAMQSDKVKIVKSAPAKSHDAIIYPLGVIKTTKHKKEAEAFFHFLQTKGALQIFQKYGFTILNKK